MDGRLIKNFFANSTGPWRFIQEASSKSYQGDQEVCRVVDGKPDISANSFPCGSLNKFSPHVQISSAQLDLKLTNRQPSQGTRDVRLDPQLNKKVWESGIKGVPYRLRVRISRKRNDEEGAKEKLYSYVQAVNVKEKETKGLHTVVVEDS